MFSSGIYVSKLYIFSFDLLIVSLDRYEAFVMRMTFLFWLIRYERLAKECSMGLSPTHKTPSQSNRKTLYLSARFLKSEKFTGFVYSFTSYYISYNFYVCIIVNVFIST